MDIEVDHLADEAHKIATVKRVLVRAMGRRTWRDDGWEVPAIDVQEALDILGVEIR